MTAPARLAAAPAALWPAVGRAEVYAVLDGARDRGISTLLGLWGLENACLHGEEISAGLRQVAPFLVRLEAGQEMAGRLLDRVWGQSLGVFAVAPGGTGFRAMQHHCRRLLRVLDPAGSVLLFRYYDPRVLRVFMPTCTPGQRAELFGPARRWVMEDAAGAAVTFEAG